VSASFKGIRKPNPGEPISFEDGAFHVGAEPCSTLVLQAGGDSDWWARQNQSLDSYKVQHEAREIDPTDLAVYRLFGSYINAAAFKTRAPNPLVLDVGCGIFPRPSPACEQLDERCHYVGLDPLPHNMDRSYPFVCGRLEDLAALPDFTPRFDLFVFGTSLDHLEDLTSAAAAVQRLAAPGALLVCWNGLHEPENVVCGNSVAVFRTVLGYKNPVVAMGAFAGYGIVRLPRLLRRMRAQRAVLAKEQSGDHHYRWFTEANTERYLSEFGELIDTVTLPNTNFGFATVRIKSAR